MQGQNSKENQDKLVDYYDDYVSRQKDVGVNLRHHSILDKLKNSGMQPNHSVLELGCGIGTLTGLLIEYLNAGKLTAMDISGKSVEEAKARLGKYNNLNLIHADAVDYDFGDVTFDVIVLPDVLEHIPVELHHKLFNKISMVLKPNGFVFIHIPNPYFIAWCHENRPDLLQIVDQAITTDLLVKNTYPNNLFIHQLKTYSIWVADGDYQYIVLKKNGCEDFNNIIEENVTFWDKVKFKWNAIFK